MERIGARPPRTDVAEGTPGILEADEAAQAGTLQDLIDPVLGGVLFMEECFPAGRREAGPSAEAVARMEQEMESLEHDFKAVEGTYAENMMNLTLARGFIKKLMDNSKIVRFLSANHADMLTEFEAIASAETV